MHLTATENLAVLREGGPACLCGLGNAIGRSLFLCWPRYRDDPASSWDVGEYDLWEDWQVREKHRRHAKKNFQPPGGMDILKLYDEDTLDADPREVYISIYLAHAVSDGFSYVPLITDIAALYESERVGTIGIDVRQKIPDMLEVMEARLRDSLYARETAQPMYLGGYLCALEPKEGWEKRVTLTESLLELLERSGERLGLSADMVILTVILGAIARVRHLREVQATLVAAMRDGPLEGDLVGHLADWRNIAVAAPQYLSILGFSQDIAMQVKRRQWTQPFLEDTFWEERCILNIRSSVLDYRGFKRQVDDFSSHQWEGKTVSWRLEFVVDQLSDKSWTMSISMAKEKYDETWCKKFFREFKALALALACDPLKSIHFDVPQETPEV